MQAFDQNAKTEKKRAYREKEQIETKEALMKAVQGWTNYSNSSVLKRCTALGLARMEWRSCFNVGLHEMPTAVLGELCLLCVCVPGVSLEKHAAGIPLGMEQEDRIEGSSGFMSQSERL